MLQFFDGMQFQFPRNVCVRDPLQHLAVHGVSNDRLIFARQILVQQLDHLFASDIQSCGRVFFGHLVLKINVRLSRSIAFSFSRRSRP